MAATTGFSFNFNAFSNALKESSESNGVSFEGQSKKWENEEQGNGFSPTVLPQTKDLTYIFSQRSD